MCAKCKKSPVEIGLKPESWAMKGCATLWQTWCSQNFEAIEADVISWLFENSQSARIMSLKSLFPEVGKVPGFLRNKINMQKALARPYREKKVKTEHDG